MKVSEIGEFGLIDLLAKTLPSPSDKKLILGIGDDAAAWYGDTSIQLATIDSLIQDVHFSLDWTSWGELGWKSLAINLSDIAAMGGMPRYALVALSLPGHTDVADVVALYQGMTELARSSGVIIIGGNVCNAPLVDITITVFGTAHTQDILTRSAARVGDKVAVTGHLGAAAAGLEMLTKRLRFEPEATESLRKAFLRPRPRIAEGQLLVAKGIKSAIDISDGLLSDLGHICKASQLSARIDVDRVPVAPAVKANFGERAIELALAGGEDYELLFTGSAEVIDSVTKAAACPVTVIGEIITDKSSRITLVDSQGRPLKLDKTGWDHFRKNQAKA